MGTSDGIAGNGDERGVGLFYLFTFLPFYFFTLLKVNTEIELEGSIVGFVETVVADVGKTDVVGEIGIEHVVADAAADADTTIAAAEVCILE